MKALAGMKYDRTEIEQTGQEVKASTKYVGKA